MSEAKITPAQRQVRNLLNKQITKVNTECEKVPALASALRGLPGPSCIDENAVAAIATCAEATKPAPVVEATGDGDAA